MPRADFPALALDGDGRQVDALASDAGHLLWSCILDADLARRVGQRLLRPDLFSGWAIRTLAAGQRPFHPLSYHRGSAWPHDNAVIALGLARYGLTQEVRTVTDGLVADLPQIAHQPQPYDRHRQSRPHPGEATLRTLSRGREQVAVAIAGDTNHIGHHVAEGMVSAAAGAGHGGEAGYRALRGRWVTSVTAGMPTAFSRPTAAAISGTAGALRITPCVPRLAIFSKVIRHGRVRRGLP